MRDFRGGARPTMAKCSSSPSVAQKRAVASSLTPPAKKLKVAGGNLLDVASMALAAEVFKLSYVGKGQAGFNVVVKFGMQPYLVKHGHAA